MKERRTVTFLFSFSYYVAAEAERKEEEEGCDDFPSQKISAARGGGEQSGAGEKPPSLFFFFPSGTHAVKAKTRWREGRQGRGIFPLAPLFCCGSSFHTDTSVSSRMPLLLSFVDRIRFLRN